MSVMNEKTIKADDMEMEELHGTYQSEFWNPDKKGEEIMGVVTRTFETTNDKGEIQKHYVVQDKNDCSHATPSHKILMDKLTPVLVGDVIYIRYEGEVSVKDKKKKSAKDYTVKRAKQKVIDDE